MWDPAGFDEFSSNKTVNIPQRNAIEKQHIQDSKKEDGLDPPFIFSLYNCIGSPSLKDIAFKFADAEKQYHVSLLEKAVDNLSPEDMNKFNNDETDQIIDQILESSDAFFEDYQARDDYIFGHLQSNLDDNLKQYITRVRSMASKDKTGVTLSKKGVEKFNEETLTNKDVVVIALYASVYRIIDEKGNVVKKSLPEPVALESRLKPIKTLCTTDLQSNDNELIKFLPRARINPKDCCKVAFDDNSGICKYTPQYCERMGMFYDDNDCKNMPGEEILSLILGNTLTHGWIYLSEKAYDKIPNVDEKAKQIWAPFKAKLNELPKSSQQIQDLAKELQKDASDAIQMVGKPIKFTEDNVTSFAENVANTATHTVNNLGHSIKTVASSLGKNALKLLNSVHISL